MKGDAVFSNESPPRFRHVLKRSWPPLSGGKGRVMFIGHNPSDAGKSRNDPTISKVCKYALSWGYNEVIMHNLMDRIGDDPDSLLKVPTSEVMSRRNSVRVIEAASSCDLVVACWGLVHPTFNIVAQAMEAMLHASGVTLYCIDTNKDGSPKHPIYILDDAKAKVWRGDDTD